MESIFVGERQMGCGRPSRLPRFQGDFLFCVTSHSNKKSNFRDRKISQSYSTRTRDSMFQLLLRSSARAFVRHSRSRFTISPSCMTQHLWYSTEPEKLPIPGGNKIADSKSTAIADQIANLTLLQAADLILQLKTRLNIQDIAIPAAAVVSAIPASALPSAAVPVEEEKPIEKLEFTVKLESFDAASKAKIIREIKNIVPGMNLVEAKKFVESVPKVVKENINKEEAEKLKSTLEALGAKVVLE